MRTILQEYVRLIVEAIDKDLLSSMGVVEENYETGLNAHWDLEFYTEKSWNVGDHVQIFPDKYAHLSAKVDDRNKTVMLTRIGVDDALKRKSIATAMVNRFVQRANELGYTVITSGVFSSDGRAFLEGLVKRGLAHRNVDNYVITM